MLDYLRPVGRRIQAASRARTGRAPGRRRRAAWVLVPAALALAAGCGGLGTSSGAPASASASPSVHGNGVAKLRGTEILKQAAKVSATARSVRIRGKISEEGDVIALNLRIAGPKAAAGTMIMNGQRMGLIRLGPVAYIKGDARFWNAAGGPNAVTMFSGKYLKTAANDKDFKDLMSLTIASKVFAELTKPEGEVTKGAAARVNGLPAITLLDGTGGKLYVATVGRPYVLRISDGKNKLDFFDYNKTMTIRPPASRLVVETGNR